MSTRLIVPLLFQDLEREHQVEQLLRIVVIAVEDVVDLVQPVKKGTSVDEQVLRGLGQVQVVFQIYLKRVVKRGIAAVGHVFQREQPLMGQHIGRELPGGLLEQVGQGHVIEMMDPVGGILPPAYAQGERRLDILALEIEVSQHAQRRLQNRLTAVGDAQHLIIILSCHARFHLSDDVVRLLETRVVAGDDESV